MKKKIIISIIIVAILTVSGGYIFYNSINSNENTKTSESEQKEKYTIRVNSKEKTISKEEYERINLILDNLTYKTETIDAIVTDYLEINKKTYSIQKDSKALVWNNKQSNISKENFEVLYDIMSK